MAQKIEHGISKTLTIVHIITNLEQGGAQTALFRLVNADKVNCHVVISLLPEELFAERLRACGVTVESVNMRSAAEAPLIIFRLRGVIKRYQPDVVQTWMYHADLLGGLAAKMSRHQAIFWNIRHSDLSPEKTKKSTILTAKLCAKLSAWIPNKIVCCAHRAQQAHIELGYNEAKTVVIQNGLELDKWHQNQALGDKFRDELGLADDAFLIGTVGRFTPEKNHFGLLQSLALVQQHMNAHVVLVGEGLDKANQPLCDEITRLNLANVHLAGLRKDMVGIMSGIDIHVLASDSEGFPNVLAEAMACQTPCISTDAGDARYIVDNFGWIVPVGDTTALANAIIDACNRRHEATSWRTLRQHCRAHIEMNFDDSTMALQYQKVWASGRFGSSHSHVSKNV